MTTEKYNTSYELGLGFLIGVIIFLLLFFQVYHTQKETLIGVCRQNNYDTVMYNDLTYTCKDYE